MQKQMRRKGPKEQSLRIASLRDNWKIAERYLYVEAEDRRGSIAGSTESSLLVGMTGLSV